MFEKNISELEKKNPILAKKIKDFPYEKVKSIEAYEAESKNIIISYKGVLLHSNEDPLREAKSIWHKTVKNELRSNDIQVIYGLGLGYLFKRAYVNANSRILLFEPSIELLRFVLENVDFSTELADDRVFVVDNQIDAAKFFEEKYLSGDKIEVLFLPSYIQLDQAGLLSLSSKLFETVKDKNIDQNTTLLMSSITTRNFLYRTRFIEKYSPVDNLAGSCKDKTAVIIAAGPSLKNDLKLIKKNRDKFIVIAILPTLALLKDNGITPDFVTVADPTYQAPKLGKYKDDLEDINLVLESRADFNLDELKFKSNFVYFPIIDKISETIFKSIPNNKIKLLHPCASVSILSFRLAELLGCKEVIFSGLDLAMTDDKFYAGDVDVKILDQNNKQLTIKVNEDEYKIITTTTKSANGSEVKTRGDYLLFIREFEKLAKDNPEIKMINTAVNGALIQGMTYQTFEEAVKNLPKIDINIDSIIEKAKEPELKEYKVEGAKMLAKTRESYNKIKPTFQKAVSIANELIDELSKETPDMDKLQNTYTESKEVFSTARTFATQDLILSCFMQAEIAEFVTAYHKDSQLSLELLKKNIEIEKKLFEKTLETIEYITDRINEFKI